MELRQWALDALCLADPEEKVATTRSQSAWTAPFLIADRMPDAGARSLPGRPARPELIHPAKVPRRSPATTAGLAALLHAIAHIEFNAIKTV